MPEDKLILDDASIIFRNFSGAPSQFNPEGKRQFSVLLDPELATKLREAGWNVRYGKRREGDDSPPQAFMGVAVSFDNYPPSVMLVTKKNKTLLTPETIGMLDWAEIQHLDLIIRPYSWSVNGNEGIKGYLQSMYVKVEEDAFAEKYADIPTSTAAVPTTAPPSDYDE